MSLMSNILAFPLRPVVQPLRRPAALVRAAVAGQPMWRRDRDLRRVLRSDAIPAPGHALPFTFGDELERYLIGCAIHQCLVSRA